MISDAKSWSALQTYDYPDFCIQKKVPSFCTIKQVLSYHPKGIFLLLLPLPAFSHSYRERRFYYSILKNA